MAQSSRTSQCIEETEWREYAAACSKYPELNRFNMEAEKQVQEVVRMASQKAALGEQAEVEMEEKCQIFLGLLPQAISSMLNTNMTAIEVIEEMAKASKNEVWGKNQDLTQLVNEYCKNSLGLLELCYELKKSIQTARSSQLFLQSALTLALSDCGPASIDCEKVSKSFHKFRSEGSPFGESFWDSFQRVHACHEQLLQKLKMKVGEKEKKIKSAEMWSKISFIMFGALAATLGICAVVAAAIAAPPAVAGALAAAASLPIASAGGWIKSLWQSRIHKMQDEYRVFEKMQKNTEIHIRELASLRVSTLGLEEYFEAMASTIGFIDFLGGDAIALRVVAEDLEMRRKEFVRDLDALEECVAKCDTRINLAITVVLDLIKKH